MGRKPNTPLSDVANNSSPNNLDWESAKHACLDRKHLTKPPLPAEVMHDLKRWSEDEVSINKREPKLQMPRNLTNTDLPTQQNTAAKSKAIELVKVKLNVRYKGIQKPIDKTRKKNG